MTDLASETLNPCDGSTFIGSTAAEDVIPNPSRREIGPLGAEAVAAIGTFLGDKTNAYPFHAAYDKYMDLQLKWHDADYEVYEARKRFGWLLPPGWRFGFAQGDHVVRVIDGKHLMFCDPSPQNIENLKTIIAKAGIEMESGDPLTKAIAKGTGHRAKETLERIEAYLKEWAERAETSGLRAAKDNRKDIEGKKLDLSGEILDQEPKTVRDLAVQASVMQVEYGDEADFSFLADALYKLAGVEELVGAA